MAKHSSESLRAVSMRWLVGPDPLPGLKTLFPTLTQVVVAALLFTATTLILVFFGERLVVIDIVIIYFALAIFTTHAGRTKEAVIIALLAPFAVLFFIFTDIPRVPVDKAEMAMRSGAAAVLGYLAINACVQRDIARQGLRKANADLESRVAERTAELEQRNVELRQEVIERKQAEETLRASEEHYRHLYTATPAMLHSIDREGRIVNVSDYWLEVLGYERSEVIGRNSVEFQTEESRRYAEEVALPDFWKRGAARDIGLQFVRKDGEIVNILLSAIAERDREGNPYSTLAVLTDITERKQAEEALRRQQEEQQTILDSVPALIFYKDRENRFLRVNRALVEASGIPREVWEGGSAFDLLPNQAEDYWRDDKAVMESGQARRNIIEPMETATGTRWYRTDKIPYRDADGQIVGIIGFAADITEQKRLEEQLLSAREELEGKVERQMLRKNPYGLTFRELTILHPLAAGKSDKAIAAELVISPLTVQKHVSNILGKMDASSRTEAATRALREGLLD